MRKALTMIMFYSITLASAGRSSTYGRGMRAAFSSPSLSTWGKRASVKSSSRLYNNYRGQMTMWGENLSSNNDDQRRIPIATPQQRRPISQDSEGRNIRRRGGNQNPPKNDSWDDFDSGDNFYTPSKVRKNDSWDDHDDDRNYRRNDRSSNNRSSNNRSPNNRRSNNNSYSRDGGYKRQNDRNGSNNNNNFRGGGRQTQQRRGSRFSDRNYDDRGGQNERFDRDGRNNKSNEDPRNKIDLRALEGAGYVHLYGLAPILNALDAGKRDFSTPEESNDFNDWDDEDDESFETAGAIKPEAKPAPYLFVQSSKSSTGGKIGSKALAASQVEKLASDLGIPIATVDKGVLNTLCQNRPHQGFILRCGNLEFETMSRIPFPSLEDSDDSINSPHPYLWLVLDEIMDPQNFGALLRSAYFLGGETNKIGIMVCSKNSAPPSPVVSAASAGALELCQVYSTSNLPRTLNAAKNDGWRVLGAAAFAPNTNNGNDDEPPVECQDLSDVEPATKKNPTILVLGSEGHGLRTLVAKACTGFVKIPGAITNDENQQKENSSVGVDSLNVSVTGGIMLWNLVNGK